MIGITGSRTSSDKPRDPVCLRVCVCAILSLGGLSPFLDTVHVDFFYFVASSSSSRKTGLYTSDDDRELELSLMLLLLLPRTFGGRDCFRLIFTAGLCERVDIVSIFD